MCREWSQRVLLSADPVTNSQGQVHYKCYKLVEVNKAPTNVAGMKEFNWKICVWCPVVWGGGGGGGGVDYFFAFCFDLGEGGGGG